MAAMHVIRRYLADNEISQAAFAKALGKPHQSYVSELLRRAERGRPVPTDICPKIEQATGGEITRHELRPDIFGPAPKKRRAA